ncbi:hypothetical protein BH10CHL1_BH10CHL1_18460 [soil metagenome]
MPQTIETPTIQKPTQGGRGWLRALLIGLGLFIVTTIVMVITRNPNLYPTVILIGNFLVPIVFVTFLYEHQHLSALTPASIAQSFIVGGLLGVLGASLLEPLLVPAPGASTQGLSIGNALTIGLIEEGCKIVAVIWLARRHRHTAAIDGLLLGTAVGMGFAALESTGYAFTAFLLSHGAIGASIVETVLRGLLAPFGHGVWTAILGAVLFRTSAPHHFRLSGAVVLAYLFVAVLHGLWDGLPRFLYIIVPPGISISVIPVTLSLIGLVALGLLYRQAMHQKLNEPSPLNG